MDKTTLKNLIIEYKSQNMSFAEVSDKLDKEHNVQMSRQAVCGLFNRATSSKQTNEIFQLSVRTTDICMYHFLGLNASNIKELLANEGFEISAKKINDILFNNEEYIKDIEYDYVNRIASMLESKRTMSEIIDKLSYKGVKPSNKKLNDLIEKGSCLIIEKGVMETLTGILESTNDRALVRSLITKYGYNFDLRDVGQLLKIKMENNKEEKGT